MNAPHSYLPPYKAFVFARPSSARIAAQEFGHVGWGFQLDENRYMIGAVENPAGLPVSLPTHTGFWCKETTAPLNYDNFGTQNILLRCDLYRELSVTLPNIDKALACQQWVSEQPYRVFGQNCLDATFQILSAYGVRGLPDPSAMENYLPINWFRHLGVPLQVLDKSTNPSAFNIDVAFYEHPEFEGEVWRVQSKGSETDIKMPDLKKWRKRISSVAIIKGTVTLYSGHDLTSNNRVLNHSCAFLDGLTRQAQSLILKA
jgi:hypothetical protein